jgi:hypothetical protein
MTDDQINIAIAEACGWDMDPEEAHEWESRGKWAKSPRGQMKFRHRFPTYCNDLNAMHEVEISLSGDGLECSLNEVRYGEALFRVINPTKDGAGTSDFDKITASARQRAEAFLRTLGKWEEQP